MLKLFFVVLITLNVFASTFDEKIKSFVGEREYLVNKNLINLLFLNRDQFIINDKIRYLKVFKVLKNNGLLNLNLYKPSNIDINFTLVNGDIKAYKILNDALNSLGFRYFLTDVLDKNGSVIFWKIRCKTEYMIDPVILLNDLQQKNCKIVDVKKIDKTTWDYKLDFTNAIISDATKVDKNEKVRFNKPLSDYFIVVDDIKSLQIIGRNLNKWFPHIVFFDKNLKILKVIKKNRIYKGFTTKAPIGTKYIKITDNYNLINIKRGLTVIVR